MVAIVFWNSQPWHGCYGCDSQLGCNSELQIHSQPWSQPCSQPPFQNVSGLRTGLGLISQPWVFFYGCDQGCDQGCEQGCEQGFDCNFSTLKRSGTVVITRLRPGLRPRMRSGLRIATLNRNLKPTGFDFFKSQPWAFSMVATMVSVSIETSLKYSLVPNFNPFGPLGGSKHSIFSFFGCEKFP